MPYAQFGIAEVYFHNGLDYNLLKKLQQRAILTLDSTDVMVKKYAVSEMILMYHRLQPNQKQIYGFLKFLSQMPNKKEFVEANTLLNEEELFEAIKSQTFALVTQRDVTSDES